VYIPEIAGGKDWTLIRMAKGARPNAALNTLNVAAGLWTGSKYLIAVDYDLDIRDPEMVVWALSYRVSPETDIIIQRGRSVGLDPTKTNYRVLIDATKVGVHPPVALPQRQYMERALELWREHPGLPEAHLRDPWYGYSLGVWTEQDQELADLITAGKYREVGQRVTERQGAADELVGLGR
jgi:4-hydroxy-3-polyprenylbenzoate decarboxylase